MTTLIAKLLQGWPKDPHALYLALSQSGSSDRNKTGGLGRVFRRQNGLFRKHTRLKIVNEAFEINDREQQVKIKDISKLYELANIFSLKEYGMAYKAAYQPDENASVYIYVWNNINKQAICLALICYSQCTPGKKRDEDADDRYLDLVKDALRDLARIYKEKLLADQITANGLAISQIIALKIQSIEDIVMPSLVLSWRVSPCSLPFREATNEIIYASINFSRDGHQDTDQFANKTYIKKLVLNEHIASLEVFNGTMMQLYLGESQPGTYQEVSSYQRIGGLHKNSVLSEYVDFKPFYEGRNYIQLYQWAEQGFPGAAKIDIASYYLAESDYHLSNAGFHNGNAIRIDYDRTLAPICLPLRNDDDIQKVKITSIYGKLRAFSSKEGYGIRPEDGYGINAEDLQSLPTLSMAEKILNNDENLGNISDYFVPMNWWAYDFDEGSNCREKIKALKKNPNYLRLKFKAMLEKIIMPEAIIQTIADVSIYNRTDKATVLAFMRQRQQKLAQEAGKVAGFPEFLRREKDACKFARRNFETFTRIRPDIFPDHVLNEKILGLYEKNFRGYLDGLGKKVEESKESAKEHERNKSMLALSLFAKHANNKAPSILSAEIAEDIAMKMLTQ